MKTFTSHAPLGRTAFFSISALLMLAHLAVGSHAAAQQPAASEEAQFIKKITDAVIKELRQGDFLQQQIELGIQNYIKKQEEAQAAARAEEARLVNEKVKNVRRVSATRDHIFGNPQAPVSLIEYSDFECPFCKRFHATPQQIVEAYPDKVNWIYRHFPLSMHNPGAQKQAEASECVAQLAGNEAFWKFTNALYNRTLSGGKGFPLSRLAPLGAELGVNDKQLQECIDSGQNAARVLEDFNEGSQIGLTGTPASILINNASGEIILKVGAQPFEAFKPDIDKMLEADRSRPAAKINP